jgi:hypothetical protein
MDAGYLGEEERPRHLLVFWRLTSSSWRGSPVGAAERGVEPVYGEGKEKEKPCEGYSRDILSSFDSVANDPYATERKVNEAKVKRAGKLPSGTEYVL